jgi:hypothetical protein
MSAKSVLLKGDNEAVVEVDEKSNALICVDTRISRGHRGLAFRAGVYNAALADAGAIEILIKVGANEPHVIFSAAAGGDAEITIFEGTTVSADGTSVPAGNRNRNSAITPVTTVFQGPTVTGDGNEIAKVLLPGGTGGNASGGGTESPTEFILKTSENYLIRIKNISGGVKPFSATMDWYEPDAS